MSKQSVNVLIKAQDRASKKFRKISKATGGLSLSFKKLAAAASIYLSGRAIKNFAQSSLELFQTQETAVNNLRASLSLIGGQYAGQIEDHKKWAASIQERTTYGDEAILDLMAKGAAMGKMHGQELQGATKAAIGLSKAYGTDLKTAMRLVARARGGDFASLKRYTITLDDSLNAQEKFNKLLEIGNDNFKLAEAETKTLGGQLQMTSNVLGDIKEKIGEALAPAVLKSTEAIRRWAVKNQDRIATWAKKTVDAVILAKDMFFDFAKFLKKDWQSAVGFAFNSFISLMQAAFKSAVQLAIAGGQGIWKGVKKGLLWDGDTYDLAMEKYREQGGREIHKGNKSEGYQADRDLWHKVYAEAKEEQKSKEVDSILGDSMSTVKDYWKKAFKGINKNAPTGLAEKWEESKKDYEKRSKALTEDKTTDGGTSPKIPKADKARDEMIKVLKKIAKNTNPSPKERRFLQPGVAITPYTEPKESAKKKLRRRMLERKGRFSDQSIQLTSMGGSKVEAKLDTIISLIREQLQGQRSANVNGRHSVVIRSIG